MLFLPSSHLFPVSCSRSLAFPEMRSLVWLVSFRPVRPNHLAF
uniref:Uncharacterized protein n=1 Tax=Arundo donax TaxID=35708 RepID=A0A0A9FYK1_ARUDO